MVKSSGIIVAVVVVVQVVAGDDVILLSGGSLLRLFLKMEFSNHASYMLIFGKKLKLGTNEKNSAQNRILDHLFFFLEKLVEFFLHRNF